MNTPRTIDNTHLKDMRSIHWISATLKRGSIICVLIFWLLLPAVCGEPAHDHIPAIAHVAGITVGRDTIELLTRRFGPGVQYTGQHPHGGRAWNVASLGVQVTADGFFYNRHGRVIDTLSISSDLHRPNGKRPLRHRSHERVLFMGSVSLGMTKIAVLRSLRSKLPPPHVRHDEFWNGMRREELGWRMSGSAGRTHSQQPRFTGWDANLLFEKGRLVGINVACE